MADVYDYYFENYLMLYNLYGRGRPRVDRETYEDLDRELLNLVKNLPDRIEKDEDELEVAEITRGQFNRIRELEFILLDDIAEALLSGRNLAPDPPDESEESVRVPTLEFRWSEDAGLEP